MTELKTSDGLHLETAWSGPAESGVVVLCHPHPQQQGTMNAPLMRAVAGRLADAGFRVLRFNFRGVGASEGGWGGGDDEVLDVAAAVGHARSLHPDLPFNLAGWSFGAVAALRWQATTDDTSPYVGIAPAISYDPAIRMPEPSDLAPAQRLIIHGDRDQFTTVEDITHYAHTIGAEVEVLAGSDHFFVFRDMAVGQRMAKFFGSADRA